MQGNLIGTLADGTTPAGNLGFGVETHPGHHRRRGRGLRQRDRQQHDRRRDRQERPALSTGVSILGNSIYNNALGRDRPGRRVSTGPRPPIPNDPGDADVGPNNYQNYPLVTSAARTAGGVTVNGSLNSRPITAYYHRILLERLARPDRAQWEADVPRQDHGDDRRDGQRHLRGRRGRPAGGPVDRDGHRHGSGRQYLDLLPRSGRPQPAPAANADLARHRHRRARPGGGRDEPRLYDRGHERRPRRGAGPRP